MSVCQDRISDLHDNTLQHILSFVPTKCAVHTSVLSKRWKYVWTGIPILDISDQLPYATGSSTRDLNLRKTSFMNFVDGVLHHRNGSKITKFHLSCATGSASHINTWLSSVLGCNAQEINLSIYQVIDPFKFPLRLLTRESLTTVKINVQSYIKIPDSCCFSSLKVLHLGFVTFMCNCPAELVFFNFPILEELFLRSCDWMNIKAVNICAPTMKSLTIVDYENDEMCVCRFKIDAASLLYLKIEGALWQECSMCNLSPLVNVYLDIISSFDMVDRTRKLLREFSNLNEITLSGGTIETLLFEFGFGSDSPPLPYPNFSKLKLKFSEAHHVTELFSMLPNLESLVFTDQLIPYDEDECWTLPTDVQQSMPHLKSVEFWDYGGDETELFIVEFFLKNARVLERMTIVSSKVLLKDAKKQMKVAQQLLMFPRSSTCRIDFS